LYKIKSTEIMYLRTMYIYKIFVKINIFFKFLS